MEKYIGPVQASLAQKKARLLTATLAERPVARSPYPSRYRLDAPALELVNHANVFCREGWISAPGHSCRICHATWATRGWQTWAAAMACWPLPAP